MLFTRRLNLFLCGLLFLTSFAHLFVSNEFIYPFVTSKHFLFRFLIHIAIGFAGFNYVLDQNFRISFRKLLAGLLLLLMSMLLSNFLGDNFFQSFWSNYSRMEGAISALYFIVFFILLNLCFKTQKHWNFFFLTHVFISVVIAALAIAQKFKFIHAVDFNRVDGPFGNSTYLAIFSSYCVFICLFLIKETHSFKFKTIVYLGLFCNFVSIYLSQTRSSFLAVGLSFAFWLFYLSKNKIKAALSFFMIIVCCVFGLLFLKEQSGLKTNLWQRLSQISLQDESIQARLQIWKYCWRAFIEKPFFGWGQENFSDLTPLYEPAMWQTPWVDRAHNFILENLVNIGLFGTIIFVSLLLIYFLNLFKNDKISQNQKALMYGFMICWLINNLFSIEFFSSLYLFFVFLAYNYFLTTPQINNSRIDFKKSNFKVVTALFIFIFFAFTLNYEFVVKSFLRNRQLRELTKPEVILKIESQKPYRIELDEMLIDNQILGEGEIRIFMIQNAVFMLSQNEIHKKYYDFTDYMYQKVHYEIQKQLTREPEQLGFIYNAAIFYSQFKNLQQAEFLFRRLLQKIPNHQSFLIGYGNLKLMQGRLEEGLSFYEKAFKLDPQYAEAKMYLALGLIYNKRFDEAQIFIEELIQAQRDEVYDERLIQSLLAMNQSKLAARLIQVRDDVSEKRKN